MDPEPVNMSSLLVFIDAVMFCLTRPPKKGCMLLCLKSDDSISWPLRLLTIRSPLTQAEEASTPLEAKATWGTEASMGSGKGP